MIPIKCQYLILTSNLMCSLLKQRDNAFGSVCPSVGVDIRPLVGKGQRSRSRSKVNVMAIKNYRPFLLPASLNYYRLPENVLSSAGHFEFFAGQKMRNIYYGQYTLKLIQRQKLQTIPSPCFTKLLQASRKCFELRRTF